MKSWLEQVGPLLAFAIGAFLWVRTCSGPDPVVSDVRLLTPAADQEPYRIEATIRNRGQGEGQIGLDVRLRNVQSGRVVHRDQTLHLRSGETALAVVEVVAPRATYSAEVEAEYPPR